MAKVSETTKAKSGAVDRENGPIDPDLASVIDAWHSLPPDTRTVILAIVETDLPPSRCASGNERISRI